jgi:hypothetical protein
MTTVLRRQAATQACMDRFAGKPVDWVFRHCGKLAAHAMHKMGRKAVLLTNCRATTAAGAVKYIRTAGFKDLVDLMDATGLARIPPAAALPGDIVALASEPNDGFGCSLTVALDNGRVLGCNPVTGVIEPMIPHIFVAAWKV